MNSGLLRLLLTGLVGLSLSVRCDAQTAEAIPPTATVLWECTASVRCTVNGATATESRTERALTAEEACSAARAAIVAWANEHCTGKKIYSAAEAVQIQGVTARAAVSAPGAWVVQCRCVLKSGDEVEASVRACTYCEALIRSRRIACHWASELGGVCCCTSCVLERPCYCGRCR
jgi:hypothetical protein